MNAYEEILNMMRIEGSKDNPKPIQIGEMSSATECCIGELKLSAEDLLIAEHLKTGYHFAVNHDNPSLKDETTFSDGLKKGDLVAVYRINDETYIILERLVEI